MNNSVLLVGAGPMGIEYSKVLKALEVDTIVVGRGEKSACQFEEATGVPVIRGGLEQYLNQANSFPRTAIVAVNENSLGESTILLLKKGVNKILIEKPGGLDKQDINSVAVLAKACNATVLVGYNRRFYSSVFKAREIIREDGGVTSFNFEFTEWSHIIKDLVKAYGVKEKWFLHNSTHVIDLAFYLGGKPKDISCYTSGGLSWHPSSSIFAGSGISDTGAIFSYQANWESPGRWGVEILTRRHRLILRPLEKLYIQNIGTIAIGQIQLDEQLDQSFKPGLWRQVKDFLENVEGVLPTIQEQNEMVKIYNRMAAY